ncbi:Gfo/Idh/MocA family protein [Paenibacillaceae bacterium WGS1546]|uniref:Gfo/Idh/MocA family protein n=1 Tax=Cohnella sp. WGS1546 TaxID=3366810 RepID=UPI00372D5A52
MATSKLKIGIIGCGEIAHQKHMPALASLPQLAEMTAFCDVVQEKAAKAAQTYGSPSARVYTQYEQLLSDESIDVVHIHTPNAFHAPIAIAAMKAGKHVMCEKPMAIRSEDAKVMLETSRATGKKLTIGYQNRFKPESQTLYLACREGALGEIYFAKAHAIRRRAVPTWGVFHDKEMQGGGPLIDIGTHAIDLTLWMLDNYEPYSVTGSVYHKMAQQTEGNMFGPWNPEKMGVEDSAFAFIRMRNGATVFLESSWALNTTDVREAKTTLCGTLGGAEMKQGPNFETELSFNAAMFGRLVDIKPHIPKAMNDVGADTETVGTKESRQWLESIINDTEPLVTAEQAYVVSWLLEAVYESAASGQTIYYPG